MITLTKRQYKESEKRQDRILYLLSNKFDVHKVGISYKDKCVYFSNDNYSKEHLFGYFWNYKTLKQLQDNIIKYLNNIDQITDNLDIGRILNK